MYANDRDGKDDDDPLFDVSSYIIDKPNCVDLDFPRNE